MPWLEKATERLPLFGQTGVKSIISGHVGDFDVFAMGDVLTVTNEKSIVQKRKVAGLSKFLTDQRGQVRLTLGRTPDFSILGLWAPDGFGYALNLDDPDLSEWGYGGSTRSDTDETERR